MINKMILQGRMVRNPELKATNSGIAVCSFTVAWSEKRGENETKLFMPVTAWRATGEFVDKYFRKGQEIAVEGTLATREWQDNDGNNRSRIEMTADKVHFCGSKQDNAGSGNAGQGGYTPEPFTGAENVADSDLPF